jgi:hypothetical protein
VASTANIQVNDANGQLDSAIIHPIVNNIQ